MEPAHKEEGNDAQFSFSSAMSWFSWSGAPAVDLLPKLTGNGSLLALVYGTFRQSVGQSHFLLSPPLHTLTFSQHHLSQQRNNQTYGSIRSAAQKSNARAPSQKLIENPSPPPPKMCNNVVLKMAPSLSWSTSVPSGTINP